MESFIKKIFENRIDDSVHEKFVRFGKGVYGKRALLNLQKNNRIKVRGSFEYANDFVLLAAELGNLNFSGIILSKEDIHNIFIKNGFNADEKKKQGLYVYVVEDITSDLIKEISDKAYYLLLDGESSEISLKIKKKLPKPGKSGEGKADDKFCVLEAGLNFYEKIKEVFFWDIPDCRKCKVEHVYEITQLILPKDEKNFEIIRIKTKRKGKLIRKLNIGGKEETKEKEFEV